MLQLVTVVYKGLQKVTGGYQGVTGNYIWLQEVTGVKKGLQRVP